MVLSWCARRHPLPCAMRARGRLQVYALVLQAKKPHHTYVTAAAHDEVTGARGVAVAW
jgi:hypothetical protein